MKKYNAAAQRRAKEQGMRSDIPFSLFIVPTHTTRFIIFIPLQLHLNPHRTEANPQCLKRLIVMPNAIPILMVQLAMEIPGDPCRGHYQHNSKS